eukprot:scaffold15189_cov55-Phaeocystis_antarctica.AAC.2
MARSVMLARHGSCCREASSWLRSACAAFLRCNACTVAIRAPRARHLKWASSSGSGAITTSSPSSSSPLPPPSRKGGASASAGSSFIGAAASILRVHALRRREVARETAKTSQEQLPGGPPRGCIQKQGHPPPPGCYLLLSIVQDSQSVITTLLDKILTWNLFLHWRRRPNPRSPRAALPTTSLTT